MNAVTPKLVRLRDRLTSHRDGGDAPLWRVNPSTRFLETRTGLSWTGVREYRTPTGILRVLRRPEQVNAPGHLRRLHRLTCCDGHPADGVDVSAANYTALTVGSTGDRIDVEDCRGYPRPVGDVTVCKPNVIADIMSVEGWRDYCELYPDDAKGITRSDGPARTGTSLGYNALWYGPYVDAEIVGERDSGELIGRWEGPHGPEEYDVEHLVDPDCEVVQRLARNSGFRPELLGANHLAVRLPALGGRGAEQSELMRIVDSVDVPIAGDLARAASRVALQVPRMVTRDATWTVGAERDLPIASGDWDGDAAAASVFAWAGFDDDKPDPAKARQAFLIYDADAPELRGSYKLPIARHNGDRLEVVDAGLRAAASRLPQTDAPEEVLDRARAVLDHYFAKIEQAGARDALRKEPRMKTQIALAQDAVAKLAKLGKAAPTPLFVNVVDEVDAEKLMGIVNELTALINMLAEMASEGGEMKAKMADMVSAEEAQKKYDEAASALKEAEVALAEAKKAEGEAEKTADALTRQRDSLLAELAPLRAEQLERFKSEVVARGFDKDKIAACKDAADVRRFVVATKAGGERYAKTRDDAGSEYVVGDDIVQAVFDAVWAMLPATPPVVPPAPKPRSTFDSLPPLGNPPPISGTNNVHTTASELLS